MAKPNLHLSTADQSELLSIDIPSAAKAPKIRLITRTQIHPDPEQPRQHADAELRDSLARNGMLQPITVRPHPTMFTDFMIVDGERRWRSSDGVLNDLPCIVRNDMEGVSRRLATQLEANTGKPLTPLEEAEAFKRMIDDSGASVADLSELLGRPKSSIAERLALLELGPWLPFVQSGDLPMSHAVKVLLPIRSAADAAHEAAVKSLQGDWRFQKGDGFKGISLSDFERTVQQTYKSSMYPLTKVKGYAYGSKNPEIPAAQLAKHDEECDCGGILFDLGSGTPRKCCGNPTWWKPLDRKAKAAKRPKGDAKKPGREATKAKELYLPKEAKPLKSQHGSTPAGVTKLTNSAGKWEFDFVNPFDPSDLAFEFAPAKLVYWPSDGGYPCVGTKDAAVIKAARERFAALVATKTSAKADKFFKDLSLYSDSYTVSEAAAEILLPHYLVELGQDRHGEDEDWAPVLDVAEAFNIKLPDSLRKSNDWLQQLQKDVKKLARKDAARLLTGLLTVAGAKLKGPGLARAEAIGQEQERLAKKTIPWLTKPKEEPASKAIAPKPAAKRTPGRAANAQFLADMQPSDALGVIVGTAPLPRTEVTKKLWAYIKRKGLQDKKNRRNINADDRLMPVFGGKKVVSMFDMTKMVNKHLKVVTAPATSKPKPAAKKKATEKEIPLSRLSEETAPLPGIIADDEEDGGWATHDGELEEAVVE